MQTNTIAIIEKKGNIWVISIIANGEVVDKIAVDNLIIKKEDKHE